MKVRKLHFKYIILIQALIILFLITHICAPDATITQYVSFAATIASLILAIIAIIQGFFSSYSNEALSNRLQSASEEIKNNAGSLTTLIHDLKSEISALPQEVENRLASQSFIESKINRSSNSNDEEEQNKLINEADSYSRNYVMLGSVNGLILLHAIRLSIDHNKPFRLIDIIPGEYQSNNVENINGYLVSHLAAGFAVADQNNDEFSFSKSAIKSGFIDEAIEYVLKKHNNQQLVAFLSIVINHIEKYFTES